MTPDAVAAALSELAERPASEWPDTLRARFPDDPALARQILAWLHAQRAQAADRDALVLGDGARYEPGVRLDAGATASVWRAYDRKLRRNVAIKVFYAGAPAIEDILAEARAACEVTSEHVVRVFDVHDGESPYIVMELVGEHAPGTGALEPGASAATCRPRDLWEAVRWVRDVARGVHDAHLRNVFHRDLKPHNVLITPFSRRAKIADFGLAVSGAGRARPRSADAVEAGAARAARRISGTPGYMAPEQARGLGLALDPRDPADRATLVAVDVWGLGAIALDLLSGHPPWPGSDGVEAWELAAGGVRPPPFSHRETGGGDPDGFADGAGGRAPRGINRGPSGERIPARLVQIVDRALAARPGDRYPSAGALADELHAVLTCRPTSFDRSPAARFALWSRRNPQLTITAVVAVALAGMTLAAYAAVLHLDGQRAALADEVHAVEADKDRLAEQARAARHELDDTEANLRAQAAALDTLRRSLREEETEYHAIVQAREQAVRSANLATEALATVRDDRDVAEKTRDLYESFWTRARKEADDAARDRDAAARDRDAARAERDQAIKDRDAARAAVARTEHERDTARAERDRNADARHQAEAEAAKLLGELTAAVGSDVVHPVALPVEASDAPPKGAVHEP
ncbi:MAG TPA: protein kinase [Kofleriaceae bacterium]|nr:protein kinase [Kofleriaceae bacterium]